MKKVKIDSECVVRAIRKDTIESFSVSEKGITFFLVDGVINICREIEGKTKVEEKVFGIVESIEDDGDWLIVGE